MSTPNNGWLGLDIGGANIKAATSTGKAVSRRFSLWKNPSGLPAELGSIASQFDDHLPIAVTMTGELADCFPTKREGVESIIELVESCFPRRQKAYYLTTGQLVDADTAIVHWRFAAASNWHALATLVGNQHPDSTLLVDLGSTTCDIIPIVDGHPIGSGQTDTERMMAHELVYTGVDRSPVCAVLPVAELGNTRIQLAQEWFATMGDVYLLLGEVAPQPNDCETADGRPKTIEFARQRLSRMLCADAEELKQADLLAIAQQSHAAQRKAIVDAVAHVIETKLNQLHAVFLSGQGEPLLRKWLAQDLPPELLTGFQSLLGEEVSRCAPAYAVARIAATESVSSRET